jgi:hypothetical protein
LSIDLTKLNAAKAEITAHFEEHGWGSLQGPTSAHVRAEGPKFHIGTCLDADLSRVYGKRVVRRAFAKLSAEWDRRGNA